ncbi:MAG: ABC transporter ATP-binding protein [Eubacteriales bacterium]|nr:ABC transporter ATP-binding protein [Eubacteriales bacterium]
MNTGKESVKKRDTLYLSGQIWRYLAYDKWLLALAFFLTLAGNLLGLAGPMLSGWAIDAIHGPKDVDFPTVFYYAGWMIFFYLFSSLFSYVLSRIMIRISQRVSYQMRRDVFARLEELPVGFFDRTPAGELVSRISYDIDTLNASLTNDVLQIATSVITVLGALVMMLTIAPVLVSVLVVTVPASIFLTKYMTGKVRPLFRRRSAALGELNGYTEEMISAHQTIRAYHREKVMTERFSEKNREAVDAYYRADYYGSMTGPSVNFINNLSLALISMFGAFLFLHGRISLGALSSFVLYSRKFSGPINEAANILSEFQSAFAAAERIFRLLSEERETPDRPGAQTLVQPAGQVELRHVRFGYVPGKTVICDLNLCAPPGSLTAVVGHTGAGKTTLINLLMRFYDPQSGEILLDNTDQREFTLKSLRSSYAMVLQDTWLFTGTVYENIAYGKEGATREEVERVCRAARIHDAVLQLPNGYDTVLTEEGSNLSKGQKQLLTIARAMLLDARLLILDEATSNVDTRTEEEIQLAMRRLMADKTCFVIAHRLSTIRNADRILVVENGDITEQGTHRELMERGGAYATLYRSQFH